MTFHDDLLSARYFVEPEWQSAPVARTGARRVADSRESPLAPHYDADDLTAALRLGIKPSLDGVARKIVATYAIPYDLFVARARRRRQATRP